MPTTTPRRLFPGQEILEAHRAAVMGLPGVVGIGVAGTTGNEHVVVTVADGHDASFAAAARLLEGLRVQQETGQPAVFL